jgi:hypothetical protein
MLLLNMGGYIMSLPEHYRDDIIDRIDWHSHAVMFGMGLISSRLRGNAKYFATVSGKRRIGEIIKANHKTMWMKFMLGAKTYFIIKRHIEKHDVRRWHNDRS